MAECVRLESEYYRKVIASSNLALSAFGRQSFSDGDLRYKVIKQLWLVLLFWGDLRRTKSAFIMFIYFNFEKYLIMQFPIKFDRI